MIKDRNLTPGTRLIAVHKKQTWQGIVLNTDPITFALAGEPRLANQPESYKSLSAMGSAIMGGIACNGWRLWSVEGEAPAATEEGSEAPTPLKKAAAGFKTVRRNPNQQGLEEGKVRMFCSACVRGFIADEIVDTCPEGHTNDEALAS